MKGAKRLYIINYFRWNTDITIQIRDYQEQNITKWKKLAKKYNLKNIEYIRADAFDKKNYSKKDYNPNIVITSWVFELFEDNKLVEQAIKWVESIIQDEWFIIYTGQPWHPQLEQITHVLWNHKQEKWAMRRRSQYELDELFRKQWFIKDNMKIDNWWIFTVSSAKK